MFRAVTKMKEDSLVITMCFFKTRWRTDSRCRRFRVACLFCGVAAFLMPLPASAATIIVNDLLTSTGPGSPPGGSFEPPTVLGGFTLGALGIWLAEDAAIVDDLTLINGIKPNHLDKMLEIHETGLVVSQVNQTVDVSGLFSGTNKATFQMVFNSPAAGPIAGISLRAFKPNLTGPGFVLAGSAGNSLPIVGNLWQPLFVELLNVDPLTTLLEAEVKFTNMTIPFNGYVDAVPEPSTLLLATLGLFGLALWSRRKRA